MEYPEIIRMHYLITIVVGEPNFSSGETTSAHINHVLEFCPLYPFKELKSEVDPKQVDIQYLNQQATELAKDSTGEQAAVVTEPLAEVNRRWDELVENLADRKVRVIWLSFVRSVLLLYLKIKFYWMMYRQKEAIRLLETWGIHVQICCESSWSADTKIS